jgi:bla regulator protein blaR1
MMLTWIAYATLCSAGLALIGASVEYMLNGRTYVQRGLWIAVMFASITLPIAASSFTRHSEAAVAGGGASSMGREVAAPVAHGAGVDDRTVGIVWVAASAGIALWLLLVQVDLRRRLRRCGRAQLDETTTFVSADFGPAVVGVLRPQIVLPAWVLSLSEADKRLVLAHEVEHTRAHDPAVHLVGLAIAVLFPWNPALWWQLGRLRLAIEIDCDARVVGHRGHDRYKYGEVLVAAHSQTARRVASGLALVQRRSALGVRIDALVRMRRRSLARVGAAAGFALGLTALVAFAPAPALPSLTAVQAANPDAVSPMSVASPIAPRVDSVPTLVKEVPQRRAGTPTLRARPSVLGTIPPARLTPAGTDIEPTRTIAPLGEPAKPVIRPVGGIIVARPLGTVTAAPTSPDSTIRRTGGRGAFGRVIPRDTTPPNN